MYRLLIVDDEIDNVYWLEEMFQYDLKEELEVHTAVSGKEALELLNRIRFDVVLTDIKMPGMTGMELYDRIRENWPACKVIFLTAYPQFEDIYRVSQDKDVKYILKSEEEKVIKATVEEAFEELRQMTRRKEELRQDQWMKYCVERENFRELLESLRKKGELPKKWEKEGNFSLDLTKPMLCTLIRPERRDQADLTQEEMLENLFSAFDQYVPATVRKLFFGMEQDFLMLMTQLKQEEKETNRLFTVIQGALEYAQETLENTADMSFSAIMSSEPVTISAFNAKLLELRQLMSVNMTGEGSLIAHAEILKTEMETTKLPEKGKQMELLKLYLKNGQRENYYLILGEIVSRLNQFESMHDMNALELYYSVSVLMMQYINEQGISEKLAFRIGLYKLMNFNEYGSWAEAGSYLYDLSDVIFEEGEGTDESLSDRSLEKLTAYIEENLAGDLTLTQLAAVSGFNSSYLSRIFKQKYGIGLSEFILRKRMELSRQLLLCTGEKVQTIAKKAGYQSSHSFSRTFRACMGMSPNEYREQKK